MTTTSTHSVQDRIIAILAGAANPLKAGAIRAALNQENQTLTATGEVGIVPFTKSDVNKVVYALQRIGTVTATKSDDSAAPLWSLDPQFTHAIQILESAKEVREVVGEAVGAVG